MMSTPSGGPARQPAVLPFPSRTDIDLKHLRAFVEVADGLSFSRAAQRLFVSVPALSRQVRALERAVGCPLFQRSTHQVELTLAGEALLDTALQVLATLQRGVAATRAVGGQLEARMSALWEPVIHARGLGDLAAQRLALEAMLAQFPPPQDVSVTPVNTGGVPGLRLSPPPPAGGTDGADELVMLYLHGGAFVMGSAFGYRATVATLAAQTRTTAVAPDYRLAPEHPFPAALDDALTAYGWLLDSGVAPNKIIVAGDSAGAALAVLLLTRLVAEQLPPPALALILSPWLDLRRNVLTDRPDLGGSTGITADQLDGYIQTYANGHPLDDPRLNPLHADLTGLPPLLVQGGTGDPLLNDAKNLVRHATTCGVDTRLEIYPADTHNFHLFWSFLPAANEAMRHARQRIDTIRSTRPPQHHHGETT
jgi:monoterpene epsilon-lactone hydrolase